MDGDCSASCRDLRRAVRHPRTCSGGPGATFSGRTASAPPAPGAGLARSGGLDRHFPAHLARSLASPAPCAGCSRCPTDSRRAPCAVRRASAVALDCAGGGPRATPCTEKLISSRAYPGFAGLSLAGPQQSHGRSLPALRPRRQIDGVDLAWVKVGFLQVWVSQA